MMSVELKHHPEEWFFLHNFDIDKVFSTIQRADYLILYYIKMQAEQHPDSKVYLADLAAVMGLKVTELSKAVEKLQDNGFEAWKTAREAGRTYLGRGLLLCGAFLLGCGADGGGARVHAALLRPPACRAWRRRTASCSKHHAERDDHPEG